MGATRSTDKLLFLQVTTCTAEWCSEPFYTKTTSQRKHCEYSCMSIAIRKTGEMIWFVYTIMFLWLWRQGMASAKAAFSGPPSHTIHEQNTYVSDLWHSCPPQTGSGLVTHILDDVCELIWNNFRPTSRLCQPTIQNQNINRCYSRDRAESTIYDTSI